MNNPSTMAVREELERIRELELQAGDRLQLELTRQLDHSMARQNRMRNQVSNVASLFGQEPRNWPRAERAGRRGNGRSGRPGGSTRRGRSLDDRPAGVAGGAPPSPSTPPRYLDPLPTGSSPVEHTDEPSDPPASGNNTVRNRATAPSPNQRTAVVRRVVPPLPGISFEVPLNSPQSNNTENRESENRTSSAAGSETYRAGEAQRDNADNIRALQAGVTTGRAVPTDTAATPSSSSSSSQPETSTAAAVAAAAATTEASSTPTPAPGPLRRQGTFTRDEENTEDARASGNPTSSISRPVVSDEAVSFSVPLDTGSNNTDEDDDTVLTFRLSNSDSLTTMRPLNNYQVKGVPTRVIGSGRGNEQSKFSSPRGVAVSPINDTIVVADSSNHR